MAVKKGGALWYDNTCTMSTPNPLEFRSWQTLDKNFEKTFHIFIFFFHYFLFFLYNVVLLIKQKLNWQYLGYSEASWMEKVPLNPQSPSQPPIPYHAVLHPNPQPQPPDFERVANMRSVDSY